MVPDLSIGNGDEKNCIKHGSLVEAFFCLSVAKLPALVAYLEKKGMEKFMHQISYEG